MEKNQIYKKETIIDFKKPGMYKVVLLNDDYTTMDFVVDMLIAVFHKCPTDAAKIMLDTHEKGRGVIGVYTFDIARTKIAQVKQMALKNDFPLMIIMEPE
ncbi:MAG: ATP-dependent Clp protease adaptor ClpS [Clostridium sp.]|nr:ATP-dependent Clp protease adaptor ClpS [Clostridium sp.]